MYNGKKSGSPTTTKSQQTQAINHDDHADSMLDSLSELSASQLAEDRTKYDGLITATRTTSQKRPLLVG